MELRFSDLDRLRKCLFLASQSKAATSTEGLSSIEKLECKVKMFFHHKTLAKLDKHGSCMAQWLHLHLSPCCPGFDSRYSLMNCTAQINKWTVQKFNNVDQTHLVHIHCATKRLVSQHRCQSLQKDSLEQILQHGGKKEQKFHQNVSPIFLTSGKSCFRVCPARNLKFVLVNDSGPASAASSES